MNYGKQGISNQQKKLRSKSRRIHSFIRVTSFRLLLIAVVVCFAAGCCAGYGIYKGIISKAPSLDTISVVPTSYATTIYYNDGETIAKTLASSGSNREYVEYKNISKYAIYAFVALEDERFFDHNGIDVRSIFRAVFTDLVSGEDAGASTITQQLIKNQVFEGGNESLFIDKMTRKLQEQYLAVELESYVSKEKILEYYLNTINLGNGSYGIEKASEKYFGKSASELTISEAAVLAPIAYSPTLMNPVTYPEANKERRAATLKNMLEQKWITQTEYDEAVADTDGVYERILIQSQTTSTTSDTSTNSYFVDALINQVLEDLEAAGYTSYEATSLLYSGGLSIYTTQDQEIQNILDKEFTDESNFPSVGDGSYYELSSDWALSVYISDDNWVNYHLSDLLSYYADYEDTEGYYNHESGTQGISALTINYEDLNNKVEAFINDMLALNESDTYLEASREFTLEPECSMVVMDYETGNVLALYGGRGEKSGDRILNRATSTYRQPGSTFKVLAAFMPALDTGGCTLATTYDDTYYTYGTEGSTIKNWYTTGYEGYSSIRRAIYRSMNVVAVECLEDVGIGTSMSYLKQFGFSRLDETNDRNISLALGGLTNGVSVLELTAAYSSIANEGVYNTPRLYTEIYDHSGKLILDNKTTSTQIMKSSTAYLLTNAMEDTVTLGTGTKCDFADLDMAIAGKTGTSSNENDLWFVGYTPYYCAGIWSGFDNNFEQKNTQYHKELWSKIMEEIHVAKECESAEFEEPSSIISARVCSKCGNLVADNLCQNNQYGNLVKTEIFANGTAPTQKCTCCIEVTLCSESGMLATSACPDSYTVVLLNKDESEDALAHGGTFDTAYCLTSEMKQQCNLHDPNNPDSTVTENGNESEAIGENEGSEVDNSNDDGSETDSSNGDGSETDSSNGGSPEGETSEAGSSDGMTDSGEADGSSGTN